jgi:phage tail-like protein
MLVSLPSYSVYTYHVELTTSAGTKALGGFWHVNGLSQLPLTANYRGGEIHGLPVRRPGISKYGDIVLKRGVVDSAGLWGWINAIRDGNTAVVHCTVLITLRDETNQPIQRWKLHSATPKHWTGPTLSGKGSGDVAMEELILAHEGIEIVPPK